MTIYAFVAAILALVSIGLFVLAGLAMFDIVVVIITIVKANNRERPGYPLAVRPISLLVAEKLPLEDQK